jgi:hypothetical protein
MPVRRKPDWSGHFDTGELCYTASKLRSKAPRLACLPCQAKRRLQTQRPGESTKRAAEVSDDVGMKKGIVLALGRR